VTVSVTGGSISDTHVEYFTVSIVQVTIVLNVPDLTDYVV